MIWQACKGHAHRCGISVMAAANLRVSLSANGARIARLGFRRRAPLFDKLNFRVFLPDHKTVSHLEMQKR
jgi:hypothetical protein